MEPDVGNNQKLTAMWERILQVWRDSMGDKFTNARNSNIVQCRWQKIQKAINKFHGIYEKLERHPQSGSNLEDLKKNALRMYERLSSGNKIKQFKYMYCWEVLIKNVKWCTNQLTRSSTSDKDCLVNGNTMVTDKNTPNVGNCSVEPEKVTCGEIVRPEGRKSCKERKRKLNSENGVIEVLSKLQCTLDKQVEFNMGDMELKKELMKKEIELKEHSKKMKMKDREMRERAQKKLEQERVMNLDLSKLSPTARATYEILQAQISKEWESGGFYT